MSSPQEVLLGILKDLTQEDFAKFKWYLCQDGVSEKFKPIPKRKLETLDRTGTVDQMCQAYSNQILDITEMVLEKMKMMGVWEKNSKNISEPGDDPQVTAEPFHENPDLECSQTNKGPFHFEPNISYEHGRISYRFRGTCPGVFLCKLTGIGFTMTRGGELLYKIIQWDEELLQAAGKVPAGPLFNIQGTANAVSQLHLLHCEPNPITLPTGLSAVHMSDEGISILEPLEINESHVVVDVSNFSDFGLVDYVRGLLNIERPISSQVLLFHCPNWTENSQKVNVFLLPKNIPLSEVKQHQQHAYHIEATSSCILIKDHTYTLQCPEANLVQPPSVPFDLDCGPNYHPTFDMQFSRDKTKASVTVRTQQAQSVWEYHADLTPKGVRSALSSQLFSVLPPDNGPITADSTGDSGKPAVASVEKKKLLSIRKDFIDRVSSAVVKDLLDDLLQREVINFNEKGQIQAKQQDRDISEALIDMVLMKGDSACKIFIDAFCRLDKYLSADLNLP